MRLPPQSAEAERSLLGALLLDPDAFDEIANEVTPEDFYKESHRHIFRSMQKLVARQEAVDVVTLTAQIIDEGLIEAVGGKAYLASLSNEVPTAANVGYYSAIVSKKSMLRKLIGLSGEISEECYGEVDELEAFLNTVESRLLALNKDRAESRVKSLKEVVKSAYFHIEQLYEREEKITGVASGFLDLDNKTAGWQHSDLIIVAARPAMGKTAFCLNMAANAATRFGKVVLFCSLEMSAQQLAMRLLASEARVDVSRIRTGQLKEHEWRRLIQATATLSKAPIYIDDTPALNPQTLLSRARRVKVEAGLDMIIIDYLQLMGSSAPISSREQQISEISRTLKLIAKELNIPVIALAQLNRGVESRADKRPMLSDLRECVTGDTLVMLADGRRVPVKELVGQTPEVWSVDERGRLCKARCEAIWSVGKRPVVEIGTASGHKLRATRRHQLYTLRGWQRVDELGPGDRIAVARFLPEPISPAFSFSPSRAVIEEYGHILQDDWLVGQAQSDLFWDKLISLEPAGEEEVFDLTVPGPASWLADGVVSHNSGAIEQDADIIAFVYRDEYYNEDSEAKGIAEIIIGKHRSGSTGTIQLRFFPEFTRFENLAREGEED